MGFTRQPTRAIHWPDLPAKYSDSMRRSLVAQQDRTYSPGSGPHSRSPTHTQLQTFLSFFSERREGENPIVMQFNYR